MTTLKTLEKKSKGSRFVKIGISIPTPLFTRINKKVERIRKWKPEYNFSDFVRDALRGYVSKCELPDWAEASYEKQIQREITPE